ncbi:Ger(x)C family spore germination protein [Paenibacillus chitinolyticus]|uniref:Ger(x)C family spore germination protein n=1 Tax=Paenibacillus chitinolyticus TaxID=79263 RepID=UPI002DBADFCB|nr:Ger(x)C family spore germination protein [Paenibacillus chitinolyticus]MEC0248945.1 Ger(x)C family spore germination protein [Paenibacillus chitinolyticus]
MKLAQWSKLAGIVLVCSMLQGCWDVKDVDNRMIAAVIGIEQTEDHKVELWVRFPVPVTSQSGSGGISKDFFSSRQKGDTIVEALDELRSKLPKALDLSETRAIFVDEELAKKGLLTYLEFAVRDRLVPLNTLVALVSGSMEPIFTKSNPGGEVSGTYAKLFFEPYAGGTPQKNRVPLWSLFSRIYNPLQENIVPLLTQSQVNMFKLKGNAYFEDDKQVGILTLEETLIYEIIFRKMSNFEIETVEGANVSIRNNKTRITTKLIAGKPHIRIHTSLSLTLMDSSKAAQISSAEIENSVNAVLERRAKKVFQDTQLKKSDIFGFGNRYRSLLSSEEYEKWPEMYRDATIEFHINSKMRNTGLQLLK